MIIVRCVCKSLFSLFHDLNTWLLMISFMASNYSRVCSNLYSSRLQTPFAVHLAEICRRILKRSPLWTSDWEPRCQNTSLCFQPTIRFTRSYKTDSLLYRLPVILANKFRSALYLKPMGPHNNTKM